MRNSVLLLPVLALLLPANASARLEPSAAGQAGYSRFKSLDRDGDGVLSRAELLARGRERGAQALFALLDSDGDGSLALKEMERRGGGGAARFDAYDVNRDGKVVAREFPAFPDPVLVRTLDRDGDGALSLPELRPAFAGMGRRVDKTEPPAARVKDTRRRVWCWVPAFGSGDRWALEAPVVVTSGRNNGNRGCRTG
ncbi:EF-hand domain-containing protein [Magnetospirillum sp. UT-4]|uniref:EF-hand domain-containing protein n=1 Tax=Magnetospirillum sp. UT-4 TaxID=2681467 RepID=UPI001380D7AB|nr:EF-hand domain-containing protein [Magnetospirillum sp. UT-4]CAA7622949.1 exported hypothetical protein [Magnetospirillum sp. UT-4]